jgi:phosphatidylserine decarboxylase
MAKEGLIFVLSTCFLGLIFLASFLILQNPVLLILAILFLLFTLFLAFFFRDPERKIPPGENLVLSPADGKVIAIENLPTSDFLKAETTKISIFLSVFNVHINRIPISGKVIACKYNPGKFFPAFSPKASLENEQTEIGIENSFGKILFRQIAGILARRIVCHLKSGEEVKKGERFGLIKLGSRVDLFFPKNIKIQIKLKDKVKAGETILGVFER